MNTLFNFRTAAVFLCLLTASLATARADITVQVSVKFIHNNDPANTRPSGGIGTVAGFGAEITYGNAVLDATGRGYSLNVVEYLDIQPPPPAGQSSGYWYTLAARANRQTIESAALAAQAVWRWNPNAINIYVNNSSSGQCSFVGTGSSISLGGTVSTGTVVHEIGHIFNLAHTHAGDYTTNNNPPSGVFVASDLQDGDSLVETANDNPNISTNDQLSQALFGVPYNQPAAPPNAPFATPAQRAVVDSAFQNVMSYHTEAVLLSVQMDLWTLNANGARLPFCNGRTWFVANGGNDGAAGNAATLPLATVSSGVSHVSSDTDIVLLRNGSYAAPVGGTISKPCTLRATRGEVIVHFP
jgi:hypothetical protein